MEIGNLPENEFRIMIVNIIQDLGKRMEAKIEKMQTVYTKDLQWTRFGWSPGVGDGQGGLACYSSWCCKESDMTELLN